LIARFRVVWALVAVLIILTSSQTSVGAFNGEDKEPPSIQIFELKVRPSGDNGGRVVIAIQTRDDRNLIETPKMELNFGFQWLPGSNPPPKCSMNRTFRLNLSVEEILNYRVQNNKEVQQTFYAFGAIPKIPSLDSTCTEFRDLSKPPAVSLNSAIKITPLTSKNPFPIFSGKLYLPELKDASGRVTKSEEIKSQIQATSLFVFPWPEKLLQPCLTASSFRQLNGSSPIFTAFNFEISRARELNLEIDSIAERKVLELIGSIKDYQDFLDSTSEKSWEKIPFCLENVNQNNLQQDIKAWTAIQKRKTDDYLKQLSLLNKEQQNQNAKKTALERSNVISLLQSSISEANAYAEKLGNDVRKLTASPLEIRSGTSLGATEKSKREAAKSANNNLEKYKVNLDAELQRIADVDVRLKVILSEQLQFSDKVSIDFYKNYAKNLEILRKSRESIVLKLLQYTQFYLNEIERVKRMR
jgi:hypothetical protein